MLAYRPIGQLGDFRTDIVRVLDVLPGFDQARAQALVASAETFIRSRAEEGAKQAIPTIEAKVKAAVEAQIPTIQKKVRQTVAPLVIGTAAVSAAAIVMAFLAWRSTWRG